MEDGEKPETVTLMLEQMVPTGGLVWATTYAEGADITVDKCFGPEGQDQATCTTLPVASTKGEFLESADGTLIMIDSRNTVFLKLVNEQNTWFGEHVLGSQWVENARYVIHSSVAGTPDQTLQATLPDEDWMQAALDQPLD